MKKEKKNKVFRFIFYIFFTSFLVIYFSEITGYYEYQNHKKTILTEEQIRRFEEDVRLGKEIDLEKYLTVEDTNYNNNLSKITSKLSDGISNIVSSGVEASFKLLSRLVGE